MGRTTSPKQGVTGYFEGGDDVFTRNEWKIESNRRKEEFGVTHISNLQKYMMMESMPLEFEGMFLN